MPVANAVPLGNRMRAPPGSTSAGLEKPSPILAGSAAVAHPGPPPFRADHVGSLLRPPALRQAFRDHHAGKLDDARFAEIQDRCVLDVVRMQEDVGLKVATDGEFRRGSTGDGSSNASRAS